MAQYQYGLKVIVRVETTRPEGQVGQALRQVLLDSFADFKPRVRALAAADPQTTVVGWHLDPRGSDTGGTVEELEP